MISVKRYMLFCSVDGNWHGGFGDMFSASDDISELKSDFQDIDGNDRIESAHIVDMKELSIVDYYWNGKWSSDNILR